MKRPMRLFIDQYGSKIYARTVKELCATAGRTKARKVYVDRKDGVYHVGYAVGDRWFHAWNEFAIKQGR